MFDIHETEIDGVPTLWTDAPGPMAAILSFRVGAVDESVPTRGITHLVEHLALGPLGIQDYDHNGTVETLRTMFIVSGSPEEVVTFLRQAATSMADLPTDRLLLERAILRREAAEQPAQLGAILRGYRYGAVGPGMLAEEEYGTGWFGPETVHAWAAERFVRENATLVINRAPPPELSLPLPSGRRWPAPPVPDVSWLTMPAHVAWPHVGAALTYQFGRDPAANLATFIVHKRARNALRFQDGTVYDVAADYDTVDANTTMAVLGTDTDERNLDRVAQRMLEVHDTVVADGPTAEELAADVNSMERQFEHPDARVGYLDFQAVERLLGRAPLTPDEMIRRRRAVRPEDVQAVLKGAEDQMLVASGPNNPAPERLLAYPAWSTDTIKGETYAPAGFRLFGGPPERLTVGTDGVSLRVPNGQVTVRYDDAVAAVHWTGWRRLIGSDGFRIDIEAKHWRNGEAILDAIDRAVPAERVACSEHSPGGVEDPEGRS